MMVMRMRIDHFAKHKEKSQQKLKLDFHAELLMFCLKPKDGIILTENYTPRIILKVTQLLQAAACEGCPNQSICASAGPAAPDPDVDLIAKNLDAVKNIVLVLSGKVKLLLYFL